MKLFKYIETGYEVWDIKILLIKAESLEEAKKILIDTKQYDKYNGALSEIDFDFYGVDEIYG